MKCNGAVEKRKKGTVFGTQGPGEAGEVGKVTCLFIGQLCIRLDLFHVDRQIMSNTFAQSISIQ